MLLPLLLCSLASAAGDQVLLAFLTDLTEWSTAASLGPFEYQLLSETSSTAWERLPSSLSSEGFNEAVVSHAAIGSVTGVAIRALTDDAWLPSAVWLDGVALELPSTPLKLDQDQCELDFTWSGYQCVRVYQESVDWHAARAKCEARDAWLAKVHSDGETQLIHSPGEGVWIGANDLANEGQWVWLDGSPLDYAAWAPGEPTNSGDEDCASVTSSAAEWNDGDCAWNSWYACAMPEGLSSVTLQFSTVLAVTTLLDSDAMSTGLFEYQLLGESSSTAWARLPSPLPGTNGYSAAGLSHAPIGNVLGISIRASTSDAWTFSAAQLDGVDLELPNTPLTLQDAGNGDCDPSDHLSYVDTGQNPDWGCAAQITLQVPVATSTTTSATATSTTGTSTTSASSTTGTSTTTTLAASTTGTSTTTTSVASTTVTLTTTTAAASTTGTSTATTAAASTTGTSTATTAAASTTGTSATTAAAASTTGTSTVTASAASATGSSTTTTAVEVLAGNTEAQTEELVERLVVEGGFRIEEQVQGATVVVEKMSVGSSRSNQTYVTIRAIGVACAEIPIQVLEDRGGEAIVSVVEYDSIDTAVQNVSGVIVAAPPISVQLYDEEGKRLQVADLRTPIRLVVLANRSSAPSARCAYWGDAQGRWLTDGLADETSEAGELVCLTTHLTLFAAVLEDFATILLQCTNIEVFSEKGFERMRSAERLVRLPGLLLWTAVLASGVLVAWSDLQDRRAHQRGLWRDDCFITSVPSRMQKPLTCADYARLASKVPRALVRWCRGLSRRSCRGLQWRVVVERMRRLAEVRAVQSTLALKSGLTLKSVDEHLWNESGFRHESIALRVSKPLGMLTQELSSVVGQGCEAPGKPDASSQGFCRRVWALFRAAHPLVQLSQVETKISAAKRAKLLVDSFLGSLVVSAFFFSSSGDVLSPDSPAECESARGGVAYYFLVGIVSYSVVLIPIATISWSQERRFIDLDRWGEHTEEVARRRWRLQGLLFWTVGLGYTGACAFYLLGFAANLHDEDSWKWCVSFLAVLLRVAIFGPLLLAAILAAVGSRQTLLHRISGPEEAEGPVHPKVVELARRGITVGALFDFYALLGTAEVMPHFDAGLSTTHDVVRQAIVPLSRGGAHRGPSAYATLVAMGDEGLPDKMVTHNWGNVFAHLVAAVFADCLGERCYDHIFELLRSPDSRKDLWRRLKPFQERSYWICAFSVNQHAGICETPPPTDSHGVSICECLCGAPKHFDGDASEMNKFDDMMDYLRRRVPLFAQVIAVDDDFLLFTRIWCIAELAQASRSGIPQALKLYSAQNLDAHKMKLESLDVREAKASFPEDRDLILSKISDPVEFNRSLQDLVLNSETGLFTTWEALAVLDSAVEQLGHALADLAVVDIPGVIS